MNEWSLDILYKGFDDENFINDFHALDSEIEKCIKLTDALSHEDEATTLKNVLTALEKYTVLKEKIGSFISLNQSTDTSNSKAASLYNQLSQKCSASSKVFSKFQRYISEIKDLKSCIAQDPLLEEYSFLLTSIKDDSKYLLSDDVEEVLAKMNITGGSAWENLQSYLTSTVEVEYKGDKTTLSQIRNLAYDSDCTVRKAAYDAELDSYKKIRDSIAFSLNSIKAQVLTECELRGFDSPLTMTLHQAHMKQETLDALMSALKSYLPKFHSYLRRKAELLGHKDGLPWYDLFAPIHTEAKSYSVKEAKEYLLNHFRPFADDMADMMERAFDENWIDFFPRKGKVGGAFCANLPYVKQSRVLTNFDGSLGDIVTLAHELGHAYHGMMIENHRPLNTGYSMPVAETASTFNENIIMDAAIKEAKGNEKIALIENQLQDLTQTMCDIYSRFLFEKTVFEKCKDTFLFPDELENIMLEAQKEAYGDGLDTNYLHPYMWICKSHYYSSGLSFYNFPYAFGSLFAKGLVLKYHENKEKFVPKYRELLKATTVQNVEDVAKMVDIDLCDENFWLHCLDACGKRIDEFLELTENGQ